MIPTTMLALLEDRSQRCWGMWIAEVADSKIWQVIVRIRRLEEFVQHLSVIERSWSIV